MSAQKITGSFVALITPFNDDGSIDWEGFRTLLQFQEENGTRAVLIMGSTGEVAGRVSTRRFGNAAIAWSEATALTSTTMAVGSEA